MSIRNYTLRAKGRRNDNLLLFWFSHQAWTYNSIGKVFHISGARAHLIITKSKNCSNCFHHFNTQACSCRETSDMITEAGRCPDWYLKQ